MNVTEWLGENNKLGIDILKNKYQVKDESLDEWFDRVSGGDEDVKQLIKDKKFLFGGRTLSNRKMNQGSYANCFIEGTKVLTKDGIKSIDSICVGDEVITEDGSFQRVNDVFARDYQGDLFQIQANDIYKDIVCTPNHQFLTQNGWVRADRLLAANVRISRADRLKMVDLEFPKTYDTVDITEHFEDDDRVRIHDCEDGTIRTSVSFLNHGTMCWTRQGKPLNRHIEMTEDFRYFIGRWIGDGSITKYKKMKYPSVLQIVFNQTTEEEEALRIAKIGENLFGIAPSIRYTEQNIIAVRFENQILGSWFFGEFGAKCDGKFIPSKYDGDLKIALGLIDSDGSFSTHGAFKIVLKNLGLIQWLRDTLYLNGINTSKISRVKRYEGHFMLTLAAGIVNGKIKHLTKKTYHDKRMGIDQQKLLYRDYVLISDISILENQNCKVYNISVENNHTYTANGVIAHNCYSAGYVPDTYKGILEMNTDLGMTYKAQGGQGISLSKIRPKGTPIGDRYTSDGIIPFLELFNKTTEVTSQAGSRKGALLASLDIRHKQAEEFITIKSEDGKISKANLSMEVDDEFMECVERSYKSSVPETIIENREYSGNKISYELVPIDRFKLLAKTSHDWAEPGVLFTNEFRNYNLMEFHDEYEISTCNPCLAGDTLIQTSTGKIPISKLVGKSPVLYSMDEETGDLILAASVKIFKTKKNAEVLEIKTKETSIICTPDHKIFTQNKGWVEAKDLLKGDKLKGLDKKDMLKFGSNISYVVESIVTLDKTIDVFDIEMDTNHNFVANDIVVHNCGEQPLMPNSNCTLGSLDLSRFIVNEYTSNSFFDFDSFKSSIYTSIRALDDVLDENLPNHPLKKQRKASKNYRNIGLGVFGLATALFKMQIAYGSEESKELVDQIFYEMFREAVFASNKLAEEKGTFPKYNDSVFKSRIINNHFTEDEINELKIHGLRNCSLLSIAPAGSIGTMMMRSTGSEPEYAIKYNRKTHNLDDSYDIYCDEAQYYLDLTGESKLPDYFVCSKDVHWKDRVDMQAVIQRHIDTGISSTVNLPNNTTVEEVEQLYLYAWKKKIKGITIFRDGCKREGILTTGIPSEDDVKEQLKHVPTNAIGKKRKLITGCGSLHVISFYDPETGDLLETYLNKGSTGGCNNFMIGLSRMLSLAARSGASIEDIVDQLKSTGTCSSYAVRRATKKDTSQGSCCPMAIANALIDMHSEMQSELKSGIVSKPKLQESIPVPIFEFNAVCPECGSALAFEGGCSTCKNCGYSKCS